MFAFTPECCSESQRNGVRLQAGIAFAFDRIPHRLMEIKNLNRNPLIHPEEVIPLEEAPIMFDLCNGVIYYMAVEIRKRKT